MKRDGDGPEAAPAVDFTRSPSPYESGDPRN
jgi:hypothetical protein